MNVQTDTYIEVNDCIPGQPYRVAWDFNPEDLPEPIDGQKHVIFRVESTNGEHDEHCMVILAPWKRINTH